MVQTSFCGLAVMDMQIAGFGAKQLVSFQSSLVREQNNPTSTSNQVMSFDGGIPCAASFHTE